MAKKDPRIDAYIHKAAPFAQPILRHLRKVVHAAVPGVEEDMKWSTPHFMYRGMLCGMAAFKQHCTFGFWKGSLVLDGNGVRDAMGHFGRITSLDDLPSDRVLAGYIKKAARLNEQGVKVERKRAGSPPPLEVPAYFRSALRKHRAARQAFEGFRPSHQREYVEWLTEARTDATRQKRLEIAIAWLAEGKSRNWKYQGDRR
jgi:uncharacterized protein YdeI (YjbR/CyaY-like superfamily)